MTKPVKQQVSLYPHLYAWVRYQTHDSVWNSVVFGISHGVTDTVWGSVRAPVWSACQ